MTTDALIGIHIAILAAGFFGPWCLAGVGALVTKAIAWICDKEVNMNHTKFAYWLSNRLRRRYSADYGIDTAVVSFFVWLATCAGILIYHFYIVRLAGIAAIGVFALMHALRWMVRTGKALAKLRKMAHDHAEESEEMHALSEKLKEAA